MITKPKSSPYYGQLLLTTFLQLWASINTQHHTRPKLARSQVGSIPAEERAKIKHIIDAGVVDKAGNKSGISTDMFDFFRKAVFKEMFYNTFQRFSASPEYAQMHADIKNAYNKASDRPGR